MRLTPWLMPRASTLPSKPGDQGPPTLKRTKLVATLRMPAFGKSVKTCCHEQGVAGWQGCATPATLLTVTVVRVPYQLPALASHVCQTFCCTAPCAGERYGSKTRRPWKVLDGSL